MCYLWNWCKMSATASFSTEQMKCFVFKMEMVSAEWLVVVPHLISKCCSIQWLLQFALEWTQDMPNNFWETLDVTISGPQRGVILHQCQETLRPCYGHSFKVGRWTDELRGRARQVLLSSRILGVERTASQFFNRTYLAWYDTIVWRSSARTPI